MDNSEKIKIKCSLTPSNKELIRRIKLQTQLLRIKRPVSDIISQCIEDGVSYKIAEDEHETDTYKDFKDTLDKQKNLCHHTTVYLNDYALVKLIKIATNYENGTTSKVINALLELYKRPIFYDKDGKPHELYDADRENFE